MQIAFYIANVLEDGYIEGRILADFPGVLGYNLSVMRDHQYQDMRTVTQMMEMEDAGSGHIFHTILQIMLSYALYGEIKYGETPLSDERIQTIFRLIPQLDTAVTTTSAKERWKIVSLILIRCWHHIEDYIELCKKHQDEAVASGTGSSAGEVLSGLLQVITGSSAEGTGSEKPVSGSGIRKGVAANAAARTRTQALARKNGSGDDDEKPDESEAPGEKKNESGNLPNEIPRLSVGLLLDESGSMSCGDRSTYARAAAIILYDFCQSLNIPIMIYGHSTSWGADVDLYSYAEFDSIDRDDKFRLMDISARNSNRDGAALRFVAEQLSKRPEEIRILMLLSDGQPAARGYSGTAAEEDLRGIKQEYKRKGILFIAAAIGEDKPNIERIYGDSFLDITDLNQLPVKLTAVTAPNVPQCIRRQLEKNGFLIDSFWESVAKASSDLVRQYKEKLV